MIVRFCLYSVFKNLRFADPFMVLAFLAVGLRYTEIGLLLSYQHLLTVSTELPSGYLADRCGRRKSLILCFIAYALGYAIVGGSFLLTPPLQLLGFYIGLSFYGLGEAMRTGSHKAIILDYLDLTGQSERATEVLGLTRSFSKYSTGVSAIVGGLLLFAVQRYDLLFLLTALPAAAGMLLMYTYPPHLDGERSRVNKTSSVTIDWRQGVQAMLTSPRTLRLLGHSMLFESQLKILLKYYAQPLVGVGLAGQGIALAGAAAGGLLERSGAVWIGLLELVRESLGGIAAHASRTFERAFPSQLRALDACHGAAAIVSMLAVVSFYFFGPSLWIAAMVLILLTMLQNVRRPVFVSALNVEMEKSMRATILSAESVARAVIVAALLPIVGLLADRYGLAVALQLPAALLSLGLLLNLVRRSPAQAVATK